MLTIPREKVERLKQHISLWKDEYAIALAMSGNVPDAKKAKKWAVFWKALIHLQWHYKNPHNLNRPAPNPAQPLNECAGWWDVSAFAGVGLKWDDYKDRPSKEVLDELIEMCLTLAYKIEGTGDTP